MGRTIRKLTAMILGLTVFCLPISLQAKGYRGSALIVTLKTGSQIRGELIALKPDSLLLLGLDHKDTSVAIADIETIRVVRNSRAWQGLLYGFVPGVVGGAIWGGTAGGDEDMAVIAAFLGGLVVGAASGLVGLAAGMAAGMDAELTLAGLSQAELDRTLARLNRQAREPGVYPPDIRSQASGESEAKGLRSAQKWPRLRLTWLPELHISKAYHWREGTVSFCFTEDLPPGEAGPYTSTDYWEESFRPTFSFGRLTLAYQWSPRLAAEIEWSALSHMTDHLATLMFISTLDGLTYRGYFGSDETMRSASLLLGLSFRPLPPATLQPHSVEIGAAAGPAWSRTFAGEWYLGNDRVVVDRSTTWTARARVSYEFHFSAALSMGVFGEYRWLQVDIPAREVSESLSFYDVADPYGQPLWRMTAVTLPARTLSMGGFACGLKFGFGF